MTTEESRHVKKLRRSKGWSQEDLAHESDLSVATIRKVEQGGSVRVETLHLLARALDVPTSALFTTQSPAPVVGDESSRQHLAELRRALMPPVGLVSTLNELGPGDEVSRLDRAVGDGHALYQADRYGSVAKLLPGLLRRAEATVATTEGVEQRRAVIVRGHALLLTGKYLVQVRQYDLAYYALAEGIRLAREAGERLSAATGVVGMCWLLLRQDRFDESEQLAALTASDMEPVISKASQGELAVWGELSLRVASSALRNNRPDIAAEARRMAGTAASALNTEHVDYRSHWTTFGPVTAELKAVEDLSLMGDARGVLRRADDGLLSPRSVRNFGKPSPNNWGRHRLDVAKAHVAMGSHQDAMDELIGLKATSGEWLKHQAMARYIMSDVLKKRPRTLTQDMREMAAHLGVTE
ncbi:helix-turn-helix domain-containing protein [Streptomyces sp. NPDC059708]|uniref:helix-turn-helix domain-containing protein n=1 Tax=Streptomyces sp. NPDC059708 TaxID=3346916 RepID=UPI00367BF060